MDNQQKRQSRKITPAFTLLLLLVAILGSTLLTPQVSGWWQKLTQLVTEEVDPGNQNLDSGLVLDLIGLDPQARAAKLTEIAENSNSSSLDRNRARYLLATDLIKQRQGEKAIEWLEGLEQKYAVLAPQILLQRAKAYELIGKEEKATASLQKLIDNYPDSLMVPEALSKLNKIDSTYGDKAISQFPQHPRTHQIIAQRLEKNPDQLELLLLLAKYAADAPGMNEVRDKLVTEYESRLQAEDWQDIAAGYWQLGLYEKAAMAYQNAPETAENLYRIARGFHLSKKRTAAKGGYQKLLATYPQAKETGRGLLHLASLSRGKEALGYLERVVANFGDFAPRALLERAELLARLNNPQTAAETRQFLLDHYPNSDAAAFWRWDQATEAANQEDFATAWRWAEPITKNNPDSYLAGKAAFWIGKWAQKLERPEDAKAAFEYVMARHPQSYYSWRAASILGKPVGDFTNLRDIMPAAIKPSNRLPLLAGSPMLRELYLLGQDEEVATLWTAEIKSKNIPNNSLTVAEQYSEGLLLLSQGKHLSGINQIWRLSQREDPQDRAEWKALRQTPEYWQALFPLPYYQTLEKWSRERNLNPLLVAALMRQESRFEKEIRSPVGATGLMQVMPETGKWVAGKINLENYTLLNPEDNINLGTWYFDYTHQQYQNNSLLAIASYNAGPNQVKQWVNKYGLEDPDMFIETIPFGETQDYVRSVIGNYWNYLRIYQPEMLGEISNEQ